MPKLAVPCQILERIFASQSVTEKTGQSRPLVANINIEHANALYQLVRGDRPHLVVEIGMAFGVASLAILAALRDNGADGKLISIDPSQSDVWGNIGVYHVEQAGHAERHSLMEEFDFVALPALLLKDTQIEFAYIDGWHTFDYTLLDFFYIDKMLKENGVVGFNDCGWPAVNRAIRYVLSHRHYQELNVGLPKRYLSRSLVRTARNLVTGTTSSDRYFRKLEQWEPNWDYYKAF